MNIFNKKTTKNNNLSIEIQTLYSSLKKQSILKGKQSILKGIELPENWSILSSDELKNEARKAILEMSRSTNSDFKAKELGFKNAKHLMDLCFDFILK